MKVVVIFPHSAVALALQQDRVMANLHLLVQLIFTRTLIGMPDEALTSFQREPRTRNDLSVAVQYASIAAKIFYYSTISHSPAVAKDPIKVY